MAALIREYVNQNPKAAGIGVGAVLFVFLCVFLLRGCSPSSANASAGGEKYFYDLNTRKLVAGDARLVGSQDLGGGTYHFEDGTAGSAVEALVISCDACNGVEPEMAEADLKGVNAKLAYLVRYKVQDVAALQRLQEGGEPGEEIERLVSNVEGKKWLPESSPPAMGLMSKAYEGCPGSRPTTCAP